MSNGIVFEVETGRILKILASEIYDSPLALLRENVQNAYDAIRLRLVPEMRPLAEGRIMIEVSPQHVKITDNGVGMTEQVLRDHFWKAGSSGKKSEAARRAGVVGTFGIGAMANFGVCKRLTIITRSGETNETLRSIAERDKLSISKECISLETLDAPTEIGTTVIADLDPQSNITADAARQYLAPYVSLLPVAVYLNGTLISQQSVDDRLQILKRPFSSIRVSNVSEHGIDATVEVLADANALVLARVTNIRVGGVNIDGQLTLLQGDGPLYGLRSSFGLAPIPIATTFQFGGIADLTTLHPTAGREAISRESIDQVSRMIAVVEKVVAVSLADSDHADRNNAFIQYVVTNGQTALASRVTVHVWPDDKDISLGQVKAYAGSRQLLYYTGRDEHVIRTFANEGTVLLQIAQATPRRQLQQRYVVSVLNIAAVPDTAQILKEYRGTELSAAEASVALRLASVLRDDYLIPDVEVAFADISHGVTVLPVKAGDLLKVYLSKTGAAVKPLLQLWQSDWQLFPAFVKDFARTTVYERVKQYVPSSTRQGADALRRLLERSRELYRYEEDELGELEGLLGDYLEGKSTLKEVMRSARSASRVQSQRVSADQVGTVENILPDVAKSPVVASTAEGREYAASPPIVRDDINSDLKLLVTSTSYPLLNGFTMMLGLSDRLVKEYGEFFRWPHTTRIIWGGHRVVYIFTDSTSKVNLYYDIDLKTPIEGTQASGGVFPTTTLITKHRIYVPVPDELHDAFAVKGGAKEFYVRFDTLSGPEQ